MKATELREMPVEDLKHKYAEMVNEYFHLRIKHTLGQLENPLVLRGMRRDIARTQTLLRERGETQALPRRHRTGARTAKATTAKATRPKDKKVEG